MTETHNIHATGLLLGGQGLVLRGEPGSGKSLLALELLDAWEARGEAAHLVADDRVDIVAGADGLWMRAPARLAGLIELRGRGIVERPYVETARLDLVVDLVEDLPRLPDGAEFTTELFGITLARAPVPRAGRVDIRHQLLLVREALRALGRDRDKKPLE